MPRSSSVSDLRPLLHDAARLAEETQSQATSTTLPRSLSASCFITIAAAEALEAAAERIPLIPRAAPQPAPWSRTQKVCLAVFLAMVAGMITWKVLH